MIHATTTLKIAALGDFQDSWVSCIFRPKLDTDSGPNWTVIPAETGHRFRCKLDTDSGLKLDSFRLSTGID